MASIQWPGLGGFHAETTIDFYCPIREGDKIRSRAYFDGFDGPTESNFGGRRIKDYLRQEYWNQDGKLVARFICSRMCFERSEMQKRSESRKLEVPHPWSEQEIELIENDILAEKPRAVPRYWEDVNSSDEVDSRHQRPDRTDRRDCLRRRRRGADTARGRAPRFTQALPEAFQVGLSPPHHTRGGAVLLF